MHPGIHAKATPNKPACIMAGSGISVSYAELDERANRLAQYFRKSGLKTGDHVALLLENHHRYFEVLWAALRSGLYLTPISTHFSLDEIAFIVNDCEATCFITSQYMEQAARDLVAITPAVRTRLMVDGEIPGYPSYETTISAMPAGRIADEGLGDIMSYSSGTTGRPKGIDPGVVGAAIDAPKASIEALKKMGHMSSDTVYLSPAPLYHAAPLRWNQAVISAGGTAVVMDKFDPEEALGLIEKYRVTLSQWVPTMLIRMLKLPEQARRKHDLSSMKIAFHAAAPCPAEVKKQILDWWGPILFEYYGGSEGNGLTFTTPQDWLTHEGTVGRAMLGKLHIVGEDGRELPVGETGLVCFSDGPLFSYHNDPEKTASTRTPQGWTTLGDIGHMDAEGYLYLTDRKNFMIISGGVNIYPQEVENLLAMHPKIRDVAVIGVPNEEFGEEVKAVVQLAAWKDAGPELEKEIIEFCRERISHVKCPRTVDFVEELPRTATGKLFKRVLRDKYWPSAGK
ncbi:MAG: acyl-CoA synthetase [Sterolibacterium sp.]|nr:acyl-CoA synthetase [Sterolibacterium sp.]